MEVWDNDVCALIADNVELSCNPDAVTLSMELELLSSHGSTIYSPVEVSILPPIKKWNNANDDAERVSPTLISTAQSRCDLLAASEKVTKSIPTYPIIFFHTISHK